MALPCRYKAAKCAGNGGGKKAARLANVAAPSSKRARWDTSPTLGVAAREEEEVEDPSEETERAEAKALGGSNADQRRPHNKNRFTLIAHSFYMKRCTHAHILLRSFVGSRRAEQELTAAGGRRKALG